MDKRQGDHQTSAHPATGVGPEWSCGSNLFCDAGRTAGEAGATAGHELRRFLAATADRRPRRQGPGETPQKHKPKSLQKRGGQAGHVKSTWPLIPTDQYDLVFSCRRTTLKRVTTRAWCLWQLIPGPTTRSAHNKLSQRHDDARLPDQSGSLKVDSEHHRRRAGLQRAKFCLH